MMCGKFAIDYYAVQVRDCRIGSRYHLLKSAELDLEVVLRF